MVNVMPVIDQSRGTVSSQRRDEVDRNVGPTDEGVVDVSAVLLDPIREAIHVLRAVHDLDPQILQRWRVVRVAPEVVRPELHIQPGLEQRFDDLKNGAGPRIAIGLRYIVVDHEHAPLLPGSVFRDEEIVAVCEMETLEFWPPFVEQLLLILNLISLDAGSQIGPVRDAFAMNHHGPGLIKDLQPTASDLEGEVGVFAIRGRISLIEPAKGIKHVLPQQYRGAGAIVGFPQVIEDRQRRVL